MPSYTCHNVISYKSTSTDPDFMIFPVVDQSVLFNWLIKLCWTGLIELLLQKSCEKQNNPEKECFIFFKFIDSAHCTNMMHLSFVQYMYTVYVYSLYMYLRFTFVYIYIFWKVILNKDKICLVETLNIEIFHEGLTKHWIL